MQISPESVAWDTGLLCNFEFGTMGSYRCFWPSLVCGQYNILKSETYCLCRLCKSWWVHTVYKYGSRDFCQGHALTVNTVWDWLLRVLKQWHWHNSSVSQEGHLVVFTRSFPSSRGQVTHQAPCCGCTHPKPLDVHPGEETTAGVVVLFVPNSHQGPRKVVFLRNFQNLKIPFKRVFHTAFKYIAFK